ncbi:MAG TPA: 6,7-dimethyl-8-ribityllumazine synthase [Vicinamibacterales bacterium]
MLTVEGSQKAPGLKFAVVVSKFNDFVTDRLQIGAVEGLTSAGILGDDICVIKVPGAFEIPFAAKEVAAGGNVAAVICLGCLIRGATAHFEYIASACVHGITHAAAATGVPMTLGVLTTNSVEEAIERAGDGPANKGWEAAIAAVEMATLQRALRQPKATNSVNV